MVLASLPEPWKHLSCEASKQKKGKKKKINRLAIRLIWCYSPDNMFKYIWAHQSYQANQEFSEISHGFFSFQWLLCCFLCASAWRKNQHEKLQHFINNRQAIRKHKQIARWATTRYYQSVYIYSVSLCWCIYNFKFKFIGNVFEINRSFSGDANLTWSIALTTAILWHWIVWFTKLKMFIYQKMFNVYLFKEQQYSRCDIWNVITIFIKIYFSR